MKNLNPKKEKNGPAAFGMKPLTIRHSLLTLHHMIEQTELVVVEWHYHEPRSMAEKINQFTSLDVMKKRASTKKGIACRFSCRFVTGKETILEYVAEDSYVIDLADIIDKKELLTMIRNSYSKFKESFDLRKLGTVLQNSSLTPLDEGGIEVEVILPLLN